jgi:hypothetical protein
MQRIKIYISKGGDYSRQKNRSYEKEERPDFNSCSLLMDLD